MKLENPGGQGAAEAAERSTSSQRTERAGETRSIKISNNVMV